MYWKAHKRNKPTFTDVVRVEMLIQGLTEKELAKKSKCSNVTICSIVSKMRNPTKKTKVKVLKALGIEPTIVNEL